MPEGTIREHPVILDAPSGWLAGRWHPADASRDSGRGVLLLPPLFQEEQFSRPTLVALARRLAAEGFGVLRLDWPASGDSEGDPATIAEGDLLAAVGLGLAWLAERLSGGRAVLAVRLGAALARLASASDADRLVLLDPVDDPAAHADELLRAKVAQQTVQTGVVTMNRAAMREELAAGHCVEVYGYLLGPRLFLDLSARAALERDPAAEPPTLRIATTERFRPAPGEGPPPLGTVLQDATTDERLREVLLFDEPIWREPKAWRPDRAELAGLVLEHLADMPRGSTRDLPLEPAERTDERGAIERFVSVSVGAEECAAVVHLPSGAPASEGILMLPAGVVARQGPGRLYTCLARKLAAEGIPVLRVDLPGIGDASGAIDAATRWAAFRQLEEGLHLPAILAVVEWFAREAGLGGVTAFGLCGSGVTAALATAGSPRCGGCILVNPQFTLTDVDESGQRGGAVFGEAYVAALAPKLLRARSLWRLLTFRSDWRKILRALTDAVRSRLRRGEALHPSLNLGFVEALARASRFGKPILVALGEWDDNRVKYETEYRDKAARIARYACKHEAVPFSRADHNFTGSEPREELLATILRWMAGRAGAVGRDRER